MTRVYLVRHGLHDLVDKSLAGRMPDVHLSDQGRAQAERLARHFAGSDVRRVLTSPMARCRETAAPIARGLSLALQADDALVELDCGEWTGVSFDELDHDPRWHAWNTERENASIPGGERMADVNRRVAGLLDRLAAQDGDPAILVSHSDVIKAAVAAVLGFPLKRHDRLQIDPASITTIDLWIGGGKIVRLNEEPAP